MVCAGARHFPSLEKERMRPVEQKERMQHFEMKTTKDYYREFPGLIRSSTPLYIKSAGMQVCDQLISVAVLLTLLLSRSKVSADVYTYQFVPAIQWKAAA